jgi:tetratricopeptide (TPR) repeat protein
MFDGLYLYEVVLMVLGVVLFLVLVIGFFYQLTHKRGIAPLLAFFTMPVLMIAYPSVKSFQVSGSAVTVETKEQALQANPTDQNARKALQDQVATLSDRPIKDPATLTSLAKAQFSLGDEPQASENLKKALAINPGLPAAQQLQAKITTLEKLDQVAKKVESNPNDTQARADLIRTENAAAKFDLANPAAINKLAHAQLVLGDHDNAAKNNATALKIDPQSASAKQLQTRIFLSKPVAGPH